jgi:hypothetical protein
MAKAKEILSPEDYTNYRNVRAAAVLFVFFGSIFVLGGIGLATGHDPDPQQGIGPAGAIVFAAIFGLGGVVGGIAALRGNRRWAKLAYVAAVPYLFLVPLGTMMSYIVARGFSRYLDSKERLRQATRD